MKKLGIYIHIPFCTKKCDYCDFYSVKWMETLEDKYIKSAINELTSYSELKNKYLVDTIFLGGGTPSILKTDNLEKLINSVKSIFTVTEDAEITLEANPNTLNKYNLNEYKKMGINRLSIGIQSLDDTILKNIGRIHNSKEALGAIEKAKEEVFTNINADVMFNIPGQTIESIENTILRLIEKGIKHISYYSLKLEEGTPMYILERDNKITMPKEELEREMYYAGRDIMEKHGLVQYEISNFAVTGFECRHNLKYWNQEEYIGIGPSAHSFFNAVRYNNPSDLKEYIQGALRGNFQRNIQESLTEESLIFEYIMLRLRLNEGLKFTDFKKKFSIDFFEKYKRNRIPHKEPPNRIN